MWFIQFLIAISQASYYPEQIHTSWTNTTGELSVLWVTYTKYLAQITYQPILCSASSTTWKFQNASTVSFDEGTNTTLIQYINSVTLTGLVSTCSYNYSVSNGQYWSSYFLVSGRTPVNIGVQDSSPATFAVVADWGTGANGQYVLTLLKKEAASRDFDSVLHMGDYAYGLHSDDGTIGDEWLNMVQPITANYAYMTLPGNHEHTGNFTHYKARFSMPVNQANQGTGFFYSFNLGSAHIIMISTEGYFYYNNITTVTQKNWLLSDLQQANQYRSIRPWVIVLTHHPLYCSSTWVQSKSTCSNESALLRADLEDMLYEQGVDLVLQAHVHDYERDTAIYQNKTVSGVSDSLNMHVGAEAPIYIVNGDAGNFEGQNTPKTGPTGLAQAWSNEFGYGKLVVYNNTHLYYEQFGAVSLNVTDYVWVVKTKNRYTALASSGTGILAVFSLIFLA